MQELTMGASGILYPGRLDSDGVTSAESWWGSYENSLTQLGLGETTRGVIAEDSDFIVERGVLGAGSAGDARWPRSRQRSGVVMGAVQSGKTASMLAVTAKALDHGVDCVIILAGTRKSLWLQTLERVDAQLDNLPQRFSRREMLPSARMATEDGVSLAPASLYSISRQKVRRAIGRRRPLIAVVMKQVSHLEQMGKSLRETIYPEAEKAGRPYHVLVIDDEADDSSIVGARELDDGLDSIQERRQVPLRIRDLWRSRRATDETYTPVLHATYLAYTATPQANLLQDRENPLSPRDFVMSLRVPGPGGVSSRGSTSYRVPEGGRAWYTGGEIFYEKFAAVPLCRPIEDDVDGSLTVDAMRSYLVASAVRCLREPQRIGPASSRGIIFADAREAKESTVAPMSMLIHPSATLGEHFEVAARLLGWSESGDPLDPSPLPTAEYRTLGVAGVEKDMNERPNEWIKWLNDYERAARLRVTVMQESAVPYVPKAADWNKVRETILQEVVPGTSVRVINSDPEADDRPQYGPVPVGGGYKAAPNLSTIFVSGNVMSRGLTLEGLTTTLFTRSSSVPLADTQMQMQRWFGFRGEFIELCRVFASKQQIDLFGKFHVNDEALRSDIRMQMSAGAAWVPDFSVLQGQGFKATGKIANITGVPLFPGVKPFVRHMNEGRGDFHNLTLVASRFAGEGVTVSSRGAILNEPMSAIDVAALLESLKYDRHGPGPESSAASRWASAAHHARINETSPEWPIYRAPEVSESIELGASSPYEIAAFLRFWAACVNRNVASLFTAEDRPVQWNLIPPQTRRGRLPVFRIGLRFGEAEVVTSGPLSELPFAVRPMRRQVEADGQLAASWGSRTVTEFGVFGDESFDLMESGQAPGYQHVDGRPPGSPGLILFHVVDRQPEGQSIAVGVSIPRGGPDHVQAQPRRKEKVLSE